MEEKPRPNHSKGISKQTTEVNSVRSADGPGITTQDDAIQEAQPDGIYWKDGIYLVSTSDIDGRRRWETIILLLAEKLQDAKVQGALLELKSRK